MDSVILSDLTLYLHPQNGKLQNTTGPPDLRSRTVVPDSPILQMRKLGLLEVGGLPMATQLGNGRTGLWE